MNLMNPMNREEYLTNLYPFYLRCSTTHSTVTISLSISLCFATAISAFFAGQKFGLCLFIPFTITFLHIYIDKYNSKLTKEMTEKMFLDSV